MPEQVGSDSNRGPGAGGEPTTGARGASAASNGRGSRLTSGRRRFADLLTTRYSRGQLVAAVLIGSVGFASVVQIRATGRDDNFSGARQADLIALINSLSTASDRAEGEIADLEATLRALQDDARAGQTALDLARIQAQTLGILTGTLPAQGPGVRVTVTAESGQVGTDQLLNGIQELRDAGAEAIEINDEIRVVAQTGITDAPRGGVRVDGRSVPKTFTIDAIGDPATLDGALAFDGGFVDGVQEVGGEVSVEQRERVDVTSLADLPEPRFAEPAASE